MYEEDSLKEGEYYVIAVDGDIVYVTMDEEDITDQLFAFSSLISDGKYLNPYLVEPLPSKKGPKQKTNFGKQVNGISDRITVEKTSLENIAADVAESFASYFDPIVGSLYHRDIEFVGMVRKPLLEAIQRLTLKWKLTPEIKNMALTMIKDNISDMFQDRFKKMVNDIQR